MGKYMTYFCSLSLPDLRRRQRINAMQTVIAYRNKQTRGLIRLQRIYSLLTASIMKMYT